MTAARDPFQPSLPAAGEPGRLSTTSALQPGWPCRHCGHPLGKIQNQSNHLMTRYVACCNCDQPGGTTPA
jgi:hypothetical protein